jgi:hypothetical protein
VPPDLDRVILSCLAKEPADRPASAEALREMLDAITVPEPWSAERAQRWWDTHRPSAAVQAAAIFAGT